MFDSTEEMCVWGDSSEVQVVGHQEAGEVGRGRVQGGDGGGGGPQQGQGLPSWSRCHPTWPSSSTCSTSIRRTASTDSDTLQVGYKF